MIIGFILLTLFYFVYMVYLVVSDMNSLIIIASLAMAYVIYFGIISKKPENSLYAFLLLFLFFPKSGNDFRIFRIEELVGISFNATRCCGLYYMSPPHSSKKIEITDS